MENLEDIKNFKLYTYSVERYLYYESNDDTNYLELCLKQYFFADVNLDYFEEYFDEIKGKNKEEFLEWLEEKADEEDVVLRDFLEGGAEVCLYPIEDERFFNEETGEEISGGWSYLSELNEFEFGLASSQPSITEEYFFSLDEVREEATIIINSYISSNSAAELVAPLTKSQSSSEDTTSQKSSDIITIYEFIGETTDKIPSDFTGIVKGGPNSDYLFYELNLKDGKKNGLCQWFYTEVGGIKSEASYYKDEKKHGSSKGYYENGQHHYDSEWIDDYQHGETTSYDINGNKIKQSFFKMGVYDGPQKEWWPNGRIKADRIMKNNEIKSSKEWDENGEPLKEITKNKDFKKYMSKFSHKDITNFSVQINLKKGCGYEEINFYGKYKGYKYTIKGGDEVKWFDTKNEYSEDIQKFIEHIGDNEINELENHLLYFSYMPSDSYGFYVDSIEWDKKTPDSIKDEFEEENFEYDAVKMKIGLSECIANADFDCIDTHLNEGGNNISALIMSFKYQNIDIRINWTNSNIY